jgi:hypothetical protein
VSGIIECGGIGSEGSNDRAERAAAENFVAGFGDAEEWTEER